AAGEAKADAMQLRSPRLWISAVSLAAVLYLVMGNLGRSSPGPLATVHQRHPDLSGWRSCSQCHGGWLSGMATACLDCHAPIAEQIDASTGLHGILGEERARQCSLCHSDHLGADFAMVNQQSFAQAGFGGREDFAHDRIGFPMAGR